MHREDTHIKEDDRAHRFTDIMYFKVFCSKNRLIEEADKLLLKNIVGKPENCRRTQKNLTSIYSLLDTMCYCSAIAYFKMETRVLLRVRPRPSLMKLEVFP